MNHEKNIDFIFKLQNKKHNMLQSTEIFYDVISENENTTFKKINHDNSNLNETINNYNLNETIDNSNLNENIGINNQQSNSSHLTTSDLFDRLTNAEEIFNVPIPVSIKNQLLLSIKMISSKILHVLKNPILIHKHCFLYEKLQSMLQKLSLLKYKLLETNSYLTVDCINTQVDNINKEMMNHPYIKSSLDSFINKTASNS